jgi:hypothetical protein
MAAKFAYESEKLSQARSSLMAPHPFGQEQAFLNAFDFCSRALFKLELALVDDDSARQWIAIIQKTIDTTGIDDPKGVGVWQLKLSKLSVAERRGFSDAVDELASYFDREFWMTSE